MATAELPTLLTVPEAARTLRIGRATAYELAHAWLESGGTKGLPVVRIGGSMRVPVAALERLFALGGFGPAWQSGLDGRRRGRRSIERSAAEPTTARIYTIDIPATPATRSPAPRRTPCAPTPPGQLGLFDDQKS